MKQVFAVLLVSVILFAIGCSPSTGGSAGLDIENVWGRSSPMVAQNGAFYMTITNGSDEDEQLLSADSDACGTVELHEMYMKENDVMGMRPVPGGVITIPSGESIELKVGGLHIMCIDKLEDFVVGAVLPLTLTFENSGNISIDIEIREP